MWKYISVLENDVTIVYWNQENAGKSYNEKLPKEEIQADKYLKIIDGLNAPYKEFIVFDKLRTQSNIWRAWKTQ